MRCSGILLVPFAGCFFAPSKPSADAAIGGDVGPACGMFTPWSDPLPLSQVNSGEDDLVPALSPDGNVLVFTRQSGTASVLYYALRTGQTFGNPVALTSLGNNSTNAAWSASGDRLYYMDAGTTRRASMFHSPSSFDAPTEARELEQLSPGIEGRPTFMADGKDMYYAAQNMLQHAVQSSQVWVWHDALSELASWMPEEYPRISPDGSTLVFGSSVTGGSTQLYEATRTGSGFGSATPVQTVSGPLGDGTGATISSDGTLLIFYRYDQSFDLYYSTRSCQ